MAAKYGSFGRDSDKFAECYTSSTSLPTLYDILFDATAPAVSARNQNAHRDTHKETHAQTVAG